MRTQVDNTPDALYRAIRWEQVRTVYFPKLDPCFYQEKIEDAQHRAEFYRRKFNEICDAQL